MNRNRLTTDLVWVAVLLAALVLVVALSACGKRRGNPPAFTIAPVPQTYGDIARQINALPVPDGVSPELFLELKTALKDALAKRDAAGVSFARLPVTGDENIVDDLDFQEDGLGGWELTWHYKNVGDYAQDGAVFVEDITPIAMHYGQEGTPPAAVVADGDNNGKVEIADITPIAMHWNYEAARYSVRSSDTQYGDYTNEVGQVAVEEGVADGTGFLRFSFTLPTDESMWYRVVPLDSTSSEGVPGTPVFFQVPGDAPNITSVSPMQGVEGADVTFSAAVAGTEPLAFNWNFGGGATPATSTLRNPQVQLGAVGNYNASLTVTNDYGADGYNFTLIVNEPPPANSIDITATKTTIGIGKTTTVTVSAEDMAYPFAALGKAVMGYDLSVVEPDWSTFSIGSIGGGWWDKDGIWEEGFGDILLLTPQVFFQHMAGGWVYHTHPINSHLSSVEVNITPTSGFIPERSSGDLFNFEFTGKSGGMTVLYFASVKDPGAADPLKLTFYHDDALEKHLYAPGEPLVINVIPAAAEPPAVTWLHPEYAESGTEQAFCAGISGSPPFSLTWDFGAGATPSYFEGPLPVVTVGEPGQYEGLLTVDGAAGTTEHDFTYFVTTPDYDEVENNDGITEANALPDFPVNGFRGSVGDGGYDGDSDDYFTFYAESGDYFDVYVSAPVGGEGLTVELLDSSQAVLASAPGETEALALSWAVLASGDYFIHISTGGAGAVDYTLNAHLEILAPWHTNPVPNSSESCEAALASVQGFPCIAFRAGSVSASDLYFARNEFANGMGTWTVSQLVLGMDYGPGLDIAEVDSRPAIACVSSDGPVYFIINQNPDGTGGWDSYRVSAATSDCANVSLGFVQNNPAVVYYNEYAQQLEYARCDTGDGSGNWQTAQVYSTANPILSPSLRVLNTGRPSVSFADGSANQVWLAIAEEEDGIGDWVTYPVDASLTHAGTTSLSVNDGRPAISYTTGAARIRYAINELENGRGDWLPQSLPFAMGGDAQHLRLFSGLPVLVFQGLGETVRYATNAESDASAPWDFTVAATEAELTGAAAFEYVNSRPAFVYRDTQDDELVFARRSY